MHADIILEPFEDETLYSLIGRLSKINGYSSELTCQLILGNEKALRVADAITSIEKFTEATKVYYGSAINVLMQLTNYNFRNTITTPLLDGSNSNKWIKSISSSKVSLVTLSNFDEHLWKWCPECIKLDLNNLGISYWRIKHQLPGVFICSQHRTLLNVSTIPFRNRQKDFFFPHTVYKNCELQISIEYGLAIDLCNISEGIQNSTNIRQLLFRKTIESGIAYKGLITKSGLIHQRACHEFGNFFKGLSSIKEIHSLIKPNIFNRYANSILLGSDITKSKPLLIPMLILWLYGSWELFQNAYQWELVMYTQHKLYAPLKPSINKLDENYHRNICKAFLFNFPESKRKDFWKSNPKSCKWLNANDIIWFEKKLPSKNRKKPIQLKLF